MADPAIQPVVEAGRDPAFVPAAAGGDAGLNLAGNVLLHVNDGDEVLKVYEASEGARGAKEEIFCPPAAVSVGGRAPHKKDPAHLHGRAGRSQLERGLPTLLTASGFHRH